MKQHIIISHSHFFVFLMQEEMLESMISAKILSSKSVDAPSHDVIFLDHHSERLKRIDTLSADTFLSIIGTFRVPSYAKCLHTVCITAS